MKGKRKSYIRDSSRLFKKSLRIGWKKLAYILVVDIAFYLLAFSSLLFGVNYLLGKADVLDQMDPKAIVDSQDLQSIDLASANLQGFITSLKFAGFALLFIFIFLFSASAYLIWMKIAEKKGSLHGFLKSLVISCTFLLLFYLASYLYFRDGVNAGLDYLLILLAILFLSALAYAVFARSNKLLTAIKDAMKVAQKIYLLLLPLVVLMLTGLLTLVLAGLPTMISQGIIAQQGSILVLLVYAVFARNYIFMIVEDLLR